MAITLMQMLNTMRTGETFSLEVVAYDRKRRQGGKVMHYPECRLYEPQAEQVATRGATQVEHLREQLRLGTKQPNHGVHFTRNVQLMLNGHPTSEIRKIHPPLVIKFNEQIVLG